MRKRTLVLCAAAATSVIVPVADALRIAPLRNRDGVVLTWRAQNRVAVISQSNGRLLAIHSLRRVTPGTRVTVQGIKWGTPLQGIKWTAPGNGIKWGIKWGRNGSYQSPLRTRPKARRAVWTPVRGPIVKRFKRKAIAIGTPGGIVVVRLPTARNSEGLPGQHSLDAVNVPPLGATVTLRVYFHAHGIKEGRRLRFVKPPVPGAILPVSGAVVSINPSSRTMVLLDAQDRAYPARFKVQLPPEFTLAPFRVGDEVAAQGVLGSDGVIQATLVGPNATFRQADDPAAIQVLAGSACANALNSCPPPDGSSGAPQEGGTPPSSSGSTPPPPSPPPPDTPPPTNPPPPPPPPPPGTGSGDDGPPPGCLTTSAPLGRSWSRPRCLIEWCKEQRRTTGHRPPICRRHRQNDHTRRPRL